MTTEARALRSASSAWDNTLTFGDDWVFDDARLPAAWWARVREHDTHHIWSGEQGYYPYALLARRLRQVPWHQVLACVPRCGVKRCVNPAHLTLILERDIFE